MHFFVNIALGILLVPPGNISTPHPKQDSVSITNRTMNLREVEVRSLKTSKPDLSTQWLVDKFLENTPGINMIRRGNYALEPVVRGLSNGQITTTIDGMRIFGACTDRMDPVSSYVEPINLHKIVLRTSPDENTYGASLGGGVDFQLLRPEFSIIPALSGTIGSGYETNGDAHQFLGGISYGSKYFALQANAIYRKSSNYTAGGRETIRFSQYQKWNGSISMAYKTSVNTFLKADYLHDDARNVGYPALTMDVAYAKAHIAGLSYHYKSPVSSVSAETKVYYNTIDHVMDDTKRPSEMVAMHMDMPGWSKTFGVYSKWLLQLADRHHLTMQADAYRNRLSAEMTMYPPNGSPMFMYTLGGLQRTVGGISMSDNIVWNSPLQLKPYLRLEYLADHVFSEMGRSQLGGMFGSDLDKSGLIYNLGLEANYQSNPFWRFSLGLSRGERAPTLQERYSFYIFNRLDAFDYLGNPGLKAERSWNLNLGTTYKSQSFSADLNLYSYFLNDYIAGNRLSGYSVMTIGALGVKGYVNLPSAYIAGAEMSLQWKPVDWLSLGSVSSFVYGEDNANQALPMMAPFRSLNTLNLRLGSGSLRLESLTNAAQHHVSYSQYGETVTAGSTIFNLSATKGWSLSARKMLYASIGAENVFDKQYSQHLDIMKVLRPGRNIFFRVNIIF